MHILLITYLNIEISAYTDMPLFTHTHYMGKLNVVLPDDVENRFRKVVFEKMGRLIGNLSEALEETIENWMKRQRGIVLNVG